MNNKFSHLYFEWKHVDEVILHYALWSKIQLFYELFKIFAPTVFIIFILSIIVSYGFMSAWFFIISLITLIIISTLSMAYKFYRYKNNYLYITSKRVLFHWINWLFWDYVKKITYENIRNINYFTENFLWKIYKYWRFEIQSSHGWDWDITVYHIENWKMLTHYIDKVMSLKPEERQNFACFDPNYFKKW